MARVASNEDPDQLVRYIDARADLAERYEQAERSPAEIEAHRRERRLLQLLIGMILVIVVGGFTLSIIGLVVFGATGS